MFEFFKKTVSVKTKTAPNMKSLREMELDDFIGKPVICLSNEIENLSVGIGKQVIFMTAAHQPFLVVDDLVRKREILPMGIVFAYTKQKFEALNKIEPNARIALFYNRLEDYEIDKTKTQTEEIIPPAIWAEKVHAGLTHYFTKTIKCSV